MTDDIAVGESERLHPLFLLTGLGGAVRGVFGAYAVIGYLAVTGRLGTALLAAAAFLAFGAAGVLLYWRRFEYRVGASEIRIDSGIISRTHRSIPFDRVQDVDITQGPVARVLGIAQVRFETGASAGKEEGVLQAIRLERAHQLRELVRARRAPVVEARSTAADAPPAVYAMDISRLFLSGAFNFSLAVFAALLGLTQTVGDFIGFDPLSRSFWRSVDSFSGTIAQLVLANRLFTAVAGVVTLVVVGIATGVIRTVLRDYGFRLDRTETGLRRRRGLLSLTDVTLPVARAQAAIVGTGPVRDNFGWRDLKLQSLARDQGGSGDHVLAPLAHDEEVAAILSALGWRTLPARIAWNRVSPAYVWTLALALAPLLLIAIVEMVFVPIAGAIGIVVILGAVALRWLAWRRTGFSLDGNRILIRSGWWRRRILILPIRRIQSIDLSQSFIGRWFGIAGITFGVAGGTGLSIHRIPALSEEAARNLRGQLLENIE